MTEQISSGAGLRRIQVFALDSDGYPNGDQSGANGYDGIYLSGAQSIANNFPDIQTIPHVGDDRVLAQDYLPPNVAVSATINTAKTNIQDDAIFTNTLVETVGETEMGGMATDQQGSEIDLAIVYYRQALDTDPESASFGSRRWQMGMFPVTRLIPKGASIDQGAADVNAYNVVPTPVTSAPWQKAFTLVTNGYTDAQFLRFNSDNPAMIERWTGDNTITEFNLSFTPITVAKTAVFVDGAEVTVSAVNTTTDTVTLDSAPGNLAKIVAWFETSDNIG